MSDNPPRVGIVMGSDSDWPVLRAAAETLQQFGVAYEAKVLSAHRTPDQALDYAASAADRGIKVLIGAAAAWILSSVAARTAEKQKNGRKSTTRSSRKAGCTSSAPSATKRA